MEIEVVVEVPKGSRNKYEIDPKTGVIRLDRFLSSALRYPAEYGFVEETLADDGDPLDAMVLVDEATFPGCRIRCRPIGLFAMQDEKGDDVKILAVPAWDARTDVSQVGDVLLNEIRHFFDVYKDLEEGKHTEVHGWHGHEVAEAEIARTRERYARRSRVLRRLDLRHH
ncbi:MAG TPA: inorganic diphosphatase [Candidatus Dormibacteraeota bacterium]|nr:inorganic diphosphatase [Candidatus Dormibacteraeota bacterium]